MKITIVSGSSRSEAQSLRISKWLQERVTKNNKDIEVELIDLNNVKISLDPVEFWGGQTDTVKAMAAEYKKLEASDAVILVTPEWGGGAAPALRQFLLMSGYSLAHKPVLTVGVSATPTGGIRPIEELKHSTKNTRALIIPEPIVINNVESVFTEASANEEHDKYLTAKADYSIALLVEYAKALKQVRDSGVINHEDFAFGM